MKVYERGKGSYNLTQKDFVAKGGEKSVYRQGNLAFNIFTDKKKMIPEAKIIELSKIDSNDILKPINLLMDKSNALIGYTTAYADKIEVLCKIFTNSFRNANGIGNNTIQELINNLRELFISVHEADCLIIDANEFNFLVSNKDYKTVFGIDVNSYQTPSFPATAIMPSIRDWTNPDDFSQGTDWFAFGILSCQLFVGTHPYKGKHQGFKKNDIEGRCKKKISIFNRDTTTPKATRDFGLIPSKYMDWYLQIFEKGKRLDPPIDGGTSSAVKVKVVVIQSTDSFDIKIITNYQSDIIDYRVSRGVQIVKTNKNIFIGNSSLDVSLGVDCILTPKKLNKVLVKIENDELKLTSTNINTVITPFICKAKEKIVIGDTLFVRNDGSFMEIGFSDLGGKILPSVTSQCSIAPLASKIFPGVVYQSLLGNPHVVIPVVKEGGRTSYMIQSINELTGHKILDGKYENQVCVFITHHNNIYWRVVLKFNEYFNKYTCDIEDIHDFKPINFIVLDSGVAIMIVDDGEIRIFYNQYEKTDVKVIKDPDINTTMTLAKQGTSLKFFRENKMYQMKMK